MTANELIRKLINDGWREHMCYHRKAKMFCKGFFGFPECRTNKGRKKQVEIYIYEDGVNARKHFGVEVECAGEIADGSWHMSKVFAGDATRIDKQVETVLQTWKRAAELEA